jgi:hypothetical protein
MAEKKQESFTVTDRRLFTSEGEIRQEVSQEEVSSAAPAQQAAPQTQQDVSPFHDEPAPPAPTAAEQKEQADAYHKSAKELDARVELSGHSTRAQLRNPKAPEKTKGNLTSTEQNFLQNVLYELRMAYVEVTNALARPPQTPATSGAATKR